MERKSMLLLARLSVGTGLITAQTQKVTGIVISEEDGQPAIEAPVLVKSMQIGAITNVDGDFTLLNVPSLAKTLRVSFVGMQTQEVAIRPNVRVILKLDAEQLDEAVIAVMGIKCDCKALGHTAQDLNSGQLNKAGTTSFASAIQGKPTGVDIRQSLGAPSASSQIITRGVRSFDGNNQPPHVIDGMSINTTVDFDAGNFVTGANYADRSIDINPEDIESVNVLKGQVASALYGARASNGVTVITIKRGFKNNMNKPNVTTSINLSA